MRYRVNLDGGIQLVDENGKPKRLALFEEFDAPSTEEIDELVEKGYVVIVDSVNEYYDDEFEDEEIEDEEIEDDEEIEIDPEKGE